MKKFSRLPNHIAFIMDGNGRWAEQRNLPRIEGHCAGIESTRSVVKCLGEYHINYVTLYSFSTENWNRPKIEVNSLLKILGDSIEIETAELHQNGVKIHHIGRLERLPQRLKLAIERATELTRNNTGMNLSLAFDYGGRTEILDAVRHIITEGISPQDINEELFNSHLYTADLPYVDLVVRTGGELRISNFLLWQSAYSEYYF
ncbi:MAG: polyprenyl diphosphate synthase, partial [Dehalococcoidales bacterium]|nr:polyprenyl diphosphate synthase [Dehalococcoidales bacterium]